MKNEKENQEIHHYDGIEEHDNPIPQWFSILFVGTIVSGLIYYGYYQIGTGETLKEEYERAVVAHKMVVEEVKSNEPAPKDDELFALASNPESQKTARSIFASKCVSCHGAEGGGGIGPNLTDAYWIHGGKISQIRNTIAVGVLEKGMPPWGAVLSPADLNSIAAFTHSLRGKNPTVAKSPQGILEKD